MLALLPLSALVATVSATTLASSPFTIHDLVKRQEATSGAQYQCHSDCGKSVSTLIALTIDSPNSSPQATQSSTPPPPTATTQPGPTSSPTANPAPTSSTSYATTATKSPLPAKSAALRSSSARPRKPHHLPALPQLLPSLPQLQSLLFLRSLHQRPSQHHPTLRGCRLSPRSHLPVRRRQAQTARPPLHQPSLLVLMLRRSLKVLGRS